MEELHKPLLDEFFASLHQTFTSQGNNDTQVIHVSRLIRAMIFQKTRSGPSGAGAIFGCAFLVMMSDFVANSFGAPPPRNILLIIADDYGLDSHPFYNDDPSATFAPTPNIDALASRGVLFSNAYAYPTCSPTRSAMLTGRYGFRSGVLAPLGGLDIPGVSANEFTLPEVLAANPGVGYAAGSVGKWHLGSGSDDPNTLGGWPHFSGSLGGGLPSYTNWSKTENGVLTRNFMTYATTDAVDESLSFIQAQGTDRWFLWVAFNAGHTPFHKPPDDLHSYDALPGTTADIEANPRSYFEAMIEAMDTEIGRLLAGVDLDETTIIFIGDNGTPGAVIQPPFIRQRAKGSLYEGGTHVPMIVAGPDIVNPNRSSDAVVHVVDLYATILELAGVDLATALPRQLAFDSRSLLPILNDETFTPAVECIMAETISSNSPGRMARDGAFKLIRFDSGTDEFYDLTLDETEVTNLLDGTLSAPQQTAFDKLAAQLDAWRNQPMLFDPAIGVGGFSVDVGWFWGANLELSRKADLELGASWNVVGDATVVDMGFTYRLMDPTPFANQTFYRVGQQ